MSAFPDYIQQAELSRGWKVPKSLTKFSRENWELTEEHTACYTIKIGEVATNEHLKMRIFPSSLTKNAFTQFASLRPNSIHSWMQLERSFHEQFFRGEMNISLIDLFSIRWFQGELMDDYLARFRNMKNRCFTLILETEMVKIPMNGLDYGIKKKLVNQ